MTLGAPGVGGARTTRCSLSVQGRIVKRGVRVVGVTGWGALGVAAVAGGRAECAVGGARASRLECSAVLVCARAPSLISVRDPAGQRVGDMMGDGVFPQEAVRPLGLSGPSTWAWRQEHAGSRPRCIGFSEGRARSMSVQAGASASSPSSRSV
jgi:hypothetical protein